jgi:hypothetical protein
MRRSVGETEAVEPAAPSERAPGAKHCARGLEMRAEHGEVGLIE